MAPVAAGHNHRHIAGRAHDGHHSGIVGFVDPGGPGAVAVVGHAAQLPHGHPGVMKDVVFDVGLGQPRGGDFGGVFRAEQQQHLAAGGLLVVVGDADRLHIADNGFQHAEAGARSAFHYAVDAQNPGQGDRAAVRRIPLFHVERRPRAAGFVFGETEAVAARGAEGGLVHFAGGEAGDVADDEPQGAADGGIGAKAGAEAAGVGLDPQPRRDRAVDNHHLVGAAGSGRRARQVEPVLQRGLDRGDHHRKMLRHAAGHHRIDRQLLQRSPGVAGLHDAQGSGRVGAGAGQHRPDGGLGRRNDRQPIGPPLPPEVILHRGEVSGNAGAAGLQLRGSSHTQLPS